MTKEKIYKMVKKSDLGFLLGDNWMLHHELEYFAKLVAQHEREACAKVCETLGVHPALNVWNGGPDWYKHGKDCAEAIRARGQA
jgi:hypothetical protein